MQTNTPLFSFIYQNTTLRNAHQLGRRLRHHQLLHLVPRVVSVVAQMHAIVAHIQRIALQVHTNALPLLVLQLHIVANVRHQVVLCARHVRKQHSAAIHHLQCKLTQLGDGVQRLNRLAVVNNECLEGRFAHLQNHLSRRWTHGREEEVAQLQVAHREQNDRRVLFYEELVLLESIHREHQIAGKLRYAVCLLDVVPNLLRERHAVILREKLIQRNLR